MGQVDEEARKSGIRFRHFYSVDNKHIATIATRISEYGTAILDVGVSFCSVKDLPNKDKAKLIAMGRVKQGSKKFMTSMHIDKFREAIRNNTLLDLFVGGMHPTFVKKYVVDGKLETRNRIVVGPPDYCECEDCAGCGY